VTTGEHHDRTVVKPRDRTTVIKKHDDMGNGAKPSSITTTTKLKAKCSDLFRSISSSPTACIESVRAAQCLTQPDSWYYRRDALRNSGRKMSTKPAAAGVSERCFRRKIPTRRRSDPAT